MAKKNKMPVEKLGAKSSKPVPVKIVSDYPSEVGVKEQRNYRAEDALRDIERAETHRRDKALMSDVKKLAKEKLDSLKKIC